MVWEGLTEVTLSVVQKEMRKYCIDSWGKNILGWDQ